MSRIERILQAIIDGTSYNEAPQSRIEEILLAIKNDTDYLKSPYSRVETLLLAIKNNTDYSDLLQSRIEEILEYKLHDAVYEKDALSRIEKLLIDWIDKADYYELIGVPPLSFVSNGENLVDYKIYGNTVSEESVGELVTDGEHSGQYCIPIVVAGKNLFDKTNLNSILKCYISTSKLSPSADTRSVFIECKSATTYTVSKRRGNRFVVGWTDVLPKSGVEIQDRVTDYTATSITITTGLGAKYLVAYIYNGSQDTPITTEEMLESVQIEEGSSATDYEPHYESQTAAIYLNEPLAEGESISSRSAGVSIPTINGTTILSVNTAVQPSNIYIKYKGG